MNDAIALIEGVDENVAEGMPFFDAILNGGRWRFRGDYFDTFRHCGGLGPMILETDRQAKFLIPMALLLAAGVAFATVLTLALVPSQLMILTDLRRLRRHCLHRMWPSRESVEPARDRRQIETLSIDAGTALPMS